MNIAEILIKLQNFIPKPILFAVLGLLLIVFGVASFVLLFHWNRYAIDKSVVVSAKVIYFLGGAIILLIGFVSIFLY